MRYHRVARLTWFDKIHPASPYSLAFRTSYRASISPITQRRTTRSQIPQTTHVNMTNTLEVDRRALRQILQPGQIIPIELGIVICRVIGIWTPVRSGRSIAAGPFDLFGRLAMTQDVRVDRQEEGPAQDDQRWGQAEWEEIKDSLNATFHCFPHPLFGLAPLRLEIHLVHHAHFASDLLVHLVFLLEDLGKGERGGCRDTLDDPRTCRLYHP